MTASPLLRSADMDADERRLWDQLQTGARVDARERLFALHGEYATRIARRHARTLMSGDIEFGDLRQFAFVGLLEAIDRFDPRHGTPFRGYAAQRIAGSIRDGIAHMSDRREQLSWRRQIQRERTRSLGSGQGGARAVSALVALAEIAVGLAIGFMLEDTAMFQPAGMQPDPAAIPATGYDSVAWREIVA